MVDCGRSVLSISTAIKRHIWKLSYMNDNSSDFQKIYDIFQPKTLRYLTRLIGKYETEDIT